MFGRSGGPEALMSVAVNDFATQLPGLRDGDSTAIHDARVAIRRLREAAILVPPAHDADSLADVEGRLTKMFRVLGRARDADTEQDLVHHVEARFPLAPATLGELRASVNRTRLRARRKIVKALEALEIDGIPELLQRAVRRTHRGLAGRRRWSAILWTHIAGRAADLRMAVDRAGGVYFRKRAHSARVAIKQLRYALEFARCTGQWRDRRAIRTLRKAQEWLGQAHDREVLLERLRQLPEEGITVNPWEARSVEQFLAGEIGGLHERYLSVRTEIVQICDACRPQTHSSIKLVPVAAAALTVPTLLMLRSH